MREWVNEEERQKAKSKEQGERRKWVNARMKGRKRR
jgi:hypothetical protein